MNTFTEKHCAIMIYAYETVSQAVDELMVRGYTMDFNLQENCITCNNEKFNPEDFKIVEVYRYEGDSDPADEAVVYAIESKNGLKGILVNGFGISADPLSSEMAKKLSMS